MKYCFIFLSLLLLLGAGWFFQTSLRARSGEIPAVPDALQSLTTFTALSGFAGSADNPRLFTAGKKGDVSWFSLRFHASGVDSSDYGLRFRIRGRQSLLEKSYWSYSNGGGEPPESVADGIATFRIDRMPRDKFLWKGESLNVGVGFPPDDLREGDTIELLDFSFFVAP